MNRDQVGSRPGGAVGFPIWTVLIGRTDFDTRTSIPDPTLSLTYATTQPSGVVPVHYDTVVRDTVLMDLYAPDASPEDFAARLVSDRGIAPAGSVREVGTDG